MSQRLGLFRLSVPPAKAPKGSFDGLTALRALAEDTRARIVGSLLETPLDVSEISELLGVPQYNVSKHLRILREAGLLTVEKDGRRHLYALADGIRWRPKDRVLDLGFCLFKFEPSPSR